MKRIRSFGAAIALAFASLFAGLAPVVAPVATVAVPAAVGLAALSAPQSVRAQDVSDYWENKWIDLYFRGTAYTAPTTLYFGLSTSACSDSSFGTEVSGGNYQRASVTANSTNFANTQNSGTGASSGTGGQTSNLTVITIGSGTPSANWGTVSHFFVADASTSGNLLVCKALTTAKTINSGDAQPSFAVGAFTFTLQ